MIGGQLILFGILHVGVYHRSIKRLLVAADAEDDRHIERARFYQSSGLFTVVPLLRTCV
jgi:hypothetical protein